MNTAYQQPTTDMKKKLIIGGRVNALSSRRLDNRSLESQIECFKAGSSRLKYLLHLKETDPAEYARVKERTASRVCHDRADWVPLDGTADDEGSSWKRIKHGLVEES